MRKVRIQSLIVFLSISYAKLSTKEEEDDLEVKVSEK